MTGPTTHRRINLNDVLQQHSSTTADALTQTELLCRTLGFPFLTIPRQFRGAIDPSPGGPFNTPRSPSRSWALFLRRDHRGLLCGTGVEPPRGRGRLSGGRESQLFFGYFVTKIFSKILSDITTTGYYRGALYDKHMQRRSIEKVPNTVLYEYCINSNPHLYYNIQYCYCGTDLRGAVLLQYTYAKDTLSSRRSSIITHTDRRPVDSGLPRGEYP